MPAHGSGAQLSFSRGPGLCLYELNLGEDNSTVLEKYDPKEQPGNCAKPSIAGEYPEIDHTPFYQRNFFQYNCIFETVGATDFLGCSKCSEWPCFWGGGGGGVVIKYNTCGLIFLQENG